MKYILLFSTLLAGCATTEPYNPTLNEILSQCSMQCGASHVDSYFHADDHVTVMCRCNLQDHEVKK